MRKNRILAMTRHDLTELYAYLELFSNTYSDCESECASLRDAIREIFMEQYPNDDIDASTLENGNPRGAGRKPHHGDNAKASIQALSAMGKSVREISRLTGIPRSTVQRLKTY